MSKYNGASGSKHSQELDFELYLQNFLKDPPRLMSWKRRLIQIIVFEFVFRILLVYLLMTILKRRFWRSAPPPNVIVYSLTPDQIFRNESTNSIIDFFNEERFGRNNLHSTYLFESKSFRSFLRRNPLVTFDTSLYLIHNCMNSVNLSQTKSLIRILGPCSRRILKSGNVAPRQILRLLTEYSLWSILKENANITLVTTISQINKLPFSFYIKAPRYARQMIWYATNWHPINRKGFKESGNFLNSDLNEFLDLNLVWDQFEVQALQKNGIQNAKAFGSMLFYPKIDHVVHPIVFTITFFDVTPYKQSDNFYTEEMSIDNLLGLVRIKKELELLSAKEIKLQVKPKKSYSSLHSDKYIETLDMLSKSGDLELLSEVSNLYEVVNSSSLILGTPFTSPVLIASELGVPAAFICLAPGDFILTDRELPMSIILDANGLIEKIKNSGY